MVEAAFNGETEALLNLCVSLGSYFTFPSWQAQKIAQHTCDLSQFEIISLARPKSFQGAANYHPLKLGHDELGLKVCSSGLNKK